MPPSPAAVSEPGGGEAAGRPLPPGLDGPVPRPVRMQADVLCWIWLAIASLVAVVGVCVLVGFLGVHRLALLRSHGVTVQGQVRALTVEQGKGGPRYRVEYGFTVPAPPSPIEARQSGRAFVDQASFGRLSVGGALDVTFLPRRPDIAMLRSEVQEARNPYEGAEVLAMVFGLYAAVGGAVLVGRWRSGRHLLRLGRPAAARVLDVRHVLRGRIKVTRARFEFRDAQGVLRQGRAWFVGTLSQQVAGPGQRSFAAGDAAVALYDPARPGCTDLLPVGLVELVPPA